MTTASRPELEQLRESVRRCLDRHSRQRDTESLMERGCGHDPRTWEAMAQLGLHGLLVPEEYGGFAAGFGAVRVVLEEMGARTLCSPYLASAVFATTLLTRFGTADAGHRLLPSLASGERIATVALHDEHGNWSAECSAVAASRHGAQWRLSGAAHFVLHAQVADTLVVVARDDETIRLFGVESGVAGVHTALQPALDLTRPIARVDLDGASATLLSGSDDVRHEVQWALDAMCVAFGAEQVGGGQRCLDLTVEYARTRQQFGRPIGALQAVKHGCADLLRLLEPARSAVLAGTSALDSGSSKLPALAATVKAHCSDAYCTIAGETIQLHGAIGFSWEHEAHLHYKRAKSSALLFGSPTEHRQRLAVLLCEGQTADRRARDESVARPHAELRREVREWLAAHGNQGTPRIHAHEPFDHQASPQDQRWLALLREGRWLCLSWPEEYGGRGLSAVECLVVEEEFAAAGLVRPRLGMGEELVAPAILAHGTEEQKRRFLPKILHGDDVYCQGFSEPETGSDLAGLRTCGVVEGDEIRIDGQKIWTTGADRATMMFLLCRTDPAAPRHRGISYVFVPMADNGIEVTPIRRMSGDWGFAQEFITGARAPIANVIGGLDHGWQVAMTTLGAERAGAVATQHFGYQTELDQLIARLDKQGRLSDPVVRDQLGHMAVAVELMRCTGRRVSEAATSGEALDAVLAIDKINWSEYHCWFGSVGLDLLGPASLVRPPGDGYALDPVQRVFLESRGRRIARGTNQVQRNIIAERVLGLPK